MKKFFTNIYYLFLPLLLGSIVGVLISNKIDYEFLIQPPLSPPKFLFPIMWSIIYFLMGLSYYLFKKNTNISIKKIYYLQLFINLLWPIIFFSLKWYFISIIWIIILDIIIFYLIDIFYKNYILSFYLNILYFLWNIFATYLTIGIYLLN